MNIKRHFGFTLVELMAVITIIIILAGTAVVSYFRFSQRQAAVNDARNFATELMKVQALARNLVYPPNCVGLKKYNLVADCFGERNTECTTMSASAVCGNGLFPIFENEEVLVKTFFTYDISVNFDPGTGNIETPGTYHLTNTNDPFTVDVTTDANGNIDVKEK